MWGRFFLLVGVTRGVGWARIIPSTDSSGSPFAFRKLGLGKEGIGPTMAVEFGLPHGVGLARIIPSSPNPFFPPGEGGLVGASGRFCQDQSEGPETNYLLRFSYLSNAGIEFCNSSFSS